MLASAQARPPFRADHVGSLLRPTALRQAFKDHLAKRIDDAEFARLQDQCIHGVVRLQEEAGLPVVTDGEFRRGSYWGRFVERIDGFVIKPAVFEFRDDHGHTVEFTAPYAEEKLYRARPLALDEFVFLRDITNAKPKITLPSPSTMHFYRCSDFARKGAYRDVETFFADLSTIYRQEIADLANAGCRYIQFDEVAIALLCDPAIREKVEAAGEKPDALVDLYIESINDAVAAVPNGVAVGIHVCRGNFKGHYLASAGYESVAKQFFSRTKATHFLLEYDTERAGDFKPLRFVEDKGVVLGLVSSKLPALESRETLERRVREASQYLALEQLAISPQCGFASTVAGNPMTEADERAKLKLVTETAAAIWGRG